MSIIDHRSPNVKLPNVELPNIELPKGVENYQTLNTTERRIVQNIENPPFDQ